MKVLALASNYEPIGVIAWEKAVTLLVTNKAFVVEESDKVVRSPSTQMKIPSVIVYNKAMKKTKRAVRFSRKNVWLRDEGKCQYCAKEVKYSEYTIDHVKPRCYGGKSSWENVVVCCYSCNQKKAEKTVEQAGFKILKKPVMPFQLPYVSSIDEYYTANNIPDNWKFWIGK
jgi:hypothetical protein